MHTNAGVNIIPWAYNPSVADTQRRGLPGARLPAELLHRSADRPGRSGAVQRRVAARTTGCTTCSASLPAPGSWPTPVATAPASSRRTPAWTRTRTGTCPALIYTSGAARAPYKLTLGPTILDGQAGAASKQSVTVTATADDAAFGAAGFGKPTGAERHGGAHLRRHGAVGRRQARPMKIKGKGTSVTATATVDRGRSRCWPTCRPRTPTATGAPPARSGSPRPDLHPDSSDHAVEPPLSRTNPVHPTKGNLLMASARNRRLWRPLLAASAAATVGLGDGVGTQRTRHQLRTRHRCATRRCTPSRSGRPTGTPSLWLIGSRHAASTCSRCGPAMSSTSWATTATAARLASLSGVTVVGRTPAAPVGPIPQGTGQPGQHPAEAPAGQEVPDVLRRLPDDEGLRPVRERPAEEVPRPGAEVRSSARPGPARTT